MSLGDGKLVEQIPEFYEHHTLVARIALLIYLMLIPFGFLLLVDGVGRVIGYFWGLRMLAVLLLIVFLVYLREEIRIFRKLRREEK